MAIATEELIWVLRAKVGDFVDNLKKSEDALKKTGGALALFKQSILAVGLSRYTRGNPCMYFTSANLNRSISIHTGKPEFVKSLTNLSRVYPRTHGETAIKRLQTLSRRGLSPYTRGNL